MKGREEGKFLAVVNEIAMLLLHCTINTFFVFVIFQKSWVGVRNKLSYLY